MNDLKLTTSLRMVFIPWQNKWESATAWKAENKSLKNCQFSEGNLELMSWNMQNHWYRLLIFSSEFISIYS